MIMKCMLCHEKVCKECLIRHEEVKHPQNREQRVDANIFKDKRIKNYFRNVNNLQDQMIDNEDSSLAE